MVTSVFLSALDACFWLPIHLFFPELLNFFVVFLREELLQSQLLEGALLCRRLLQEQDEVSL